MIDEVTLRLLRERAQRDIDAGLPHGGVEGCTLAVAYEGELIWEVGLGAARADTPILLLSITKTVLEAALWRLFSDGLSPEQSVTEFIPEFMDGNAPEITIAMVETHVGGFARAELDYPDAADHKARLRAFRRWRPKGVPGSRYEYHPISGGWVLAELIERVSGRDYREFLKTEVLSPLGLASVSRVSLGEPATELHGVLLHRNLMSGYAPDPTARVPMAYGLDTLDGLALGTPAVGAVGTAAGVALLYQSYLHNPQALWQSDILAEATGQVRVDAPDPAGRPMLRTLSFVRAGTVEDRYGERTFFGEAVSPRAFGHQGQGGQIAWADPQTGLSFCYLTNTVVFPPGGCFHPRARELSTLAANLVNG